MMFDPFALAAIIIVILLLPFVLFILAHTARRSGQDEWDRAEQARHRRPPRRRYMLRYIDALDGEPGSRRPQLSMSRSKKARKNRHPIARSVVAAGRSAVMRAVDDRSCQAGSRTQEHTSNSKDNAKRGARIDELWFDRV
jgi:hypothetical protein